MFKTSEVKHPSSFRQSATDDLDGFTTGVLSLADWVSENYQQKTDKFRDAVSRAKRAFGSIPPVEPKSDDS